MQLSREAGQPYHVRAVPPRRMSPVIGYPCRRRNGQSITPAA